MKLDGAPCYRGSTMRDRQTLLVDALALPEDQRADLVLQRISPRLAEGLMRRIGLRATQKALAERRRGALAA